ncbi:hypothetical protein [Bacillus sp. N1-1]|uniref:hypothetical protein n=1 Tax=Bacillus sp. N1-1 TaxID=2682541 RepID=UPI00131808EC|nr:hypothetical protein [Bacillus sp. N1-1]QHA93118.1 hypothetical protein GNK04_17665 [Bacillus sp. N1-1]
MSLNKRKEEDNRKRENALKLLESWINKYEKEEMNNNVETVREGSNYDEKV